MKGIILACLLVLCFAASVVCAEGLPKWDMTLDNAYVSEYVWRGLQLNPDATYQPSLTFSDEESGVSINIWGSMDTTDVYGQSGSFTELDYTLSYGWDASCCGMSAGWIHYTFPNTEFAGTNELFVSSCFGGTLSPTLGINLDVDEAKGFYASLGAGYDCAFPWLKGEEKKLNLSAKVSFGSDNYNDFYYFTNKFALTDASITASMPFTVGEKMTLTPSVSYSTLLDSDIKDNVEAAGLKADNFYGGVTLSMSF